MAKLITAAEAAAMIQDEDVIICATFGASGVPEDIYSWKQDIQKILHTHTLQEAEASQH